MRTRYKYQQILVSTRIGGAEKIALDIHRYLDSRQPGASRLIVPAGGESERVASATGQFCTYSLEELMHPGRLTSWLANLTLFARIGRCAGSLLHVHSPFVYGALQPLFRLAGARVVLHLHLDYSEEELKWPLRHPPDLLVMCARFMRPRIEALLSRAGATQTRLAVISNAVDTTRYRPADRAPRRDALGLGDGRPVYLMAANLARHKGQHTAIRAVARLRERGINPVLLIVGEERDPAIGYENEIRTLATSLRLGDAVQFLGFRDDIPELMQAADCFLLPSVQEGLPLAVLEAQASRAVVLAAPTAGIPEIVEHGRTGYLIAADDADGYARVLEDLHRNRDLSRSVEESAYLQATTKFSMPAYLEAVWSEYQKVLA